MIGKHTDILIESEIVRADARDLRDTRGRDKEKEKEKDARESTQFPP